MNFKLNKDSLNFNVYVETAFPETAEENDIVIISETPMVNWIISPDEPNGAPRNDGDVWLTYSTSGKVFNALKQNSMMIAMIFAKQYVNGMWEYREAKIYQNGEWTDWWDGMTYYEDGRFYKISGFTAVRATVENTGVLKFTESGNAYALAYSDKKILIDGKTTLHVKISAGGWTYSSYGLQIGLSADIPTSNEKTGALNTWAVSTKGTTANVQNGYVFDIDISSVPYGEYYFCIAFAGSSSQTGEIYVESIRIM